jgi:myo-inositol-1(or 4)-monophosphatase
MLSDRLFESIYQDAKRWTLEAGQRLKESLQDALEIEYKTSAADIVTQKDKEIEQFFVEKINATFPDHYILGEEGMATEESYNPQEEIVWIIDPIDGTTNFVHQKQNFSISVAVYEKGEPRIGIIYDPIQDECFHATLGQGAYLNDQKLDHLSTGPIEEAVMGINCLWLTPNKKFDHNKLQSLVRHVRGTRSIGSAALEMASVACGRLDAYLTLRLSPWDFAAGLVILDELGAKMTTIHNEEINVFSKSTIFVARPGLHENITERFLQAPDAPGFVKNV